jgi:hypothetical protein
MTAVPFILDPLAAAPAYLVITRIERPPRFESSQRPGRSGMPSVSDSPGRDA